MALVDNEFGFGPDDRVRFQASLSAFSLIEFGWPTHRAPTLWGQIMGLELRVSFWISTLSTLSKKTSSKQNRWLSDATHVKQDDHILYIVYICSNEVVKFFTLQRPDLTISIYILVALTIAPMANSNGSARESH